MPIPEDDKKKEGDQSGEGPGDDKAIDYGKMTEQEVADFVNKHANFVGYRDKMVHSGIESSKTKEAEKAKIAEAEKKLEDAKGKMSPEMKMVLDRLDSMEAASKKLTLEQQIEKACDAKNIPEKFRGFVTSVEQVDNVAAAFKGEIAVAVANANKGKVINPDGNLETKEGPKNSPEELIAAEKAGQTPEEYALWRDDPEAAIKKMSEKKT